MLIIPAIDLKDGCVVRFVQGRLNMKIYSRDPVKTAKHWAKQGAKMIHVVDLDGAFTGKPKNLGALKEIVKAVKAPVNFGGGARNAKIIEEVLGLGVRRVILGTKAVEDLSFLKKIFKRFKERIIVSIDTKEGRVLTKGWKVRSKGTDILKFARALKEIGFKEAIYTDILKDGTLKGPDLQGVKALLKGTGLKVIASGGVSSLDDIRRLKALKKGGLTGVIVGKALYEGRFTLKEALKLS